MLFDLIVPFCIKKVRFAVTKWHSLDLTGQFLWVRVYLDSKTIDLAQL
jgi:hypothetical protein